MPAVCGTPLYRTGHMMSSEGVRTEGRQRWMTRQWTADADATKIVYKIGFILPWCCRLTLMSFNIKFNLVIGDV